MLTFSQNLERIAAQRDANDPLVLAKRELALTRASAMAAIEEFDNEARHHAPAFGDALNKWEQAARAGIVYSELQKYVSQAMDHLQSGRAAFVDVVNRIDALGEWDVLQGLHLRLPAMLNGRRANIGAIADMARLVEYHVSVLDEIVESAAQR
jgi:hypothetical protein